MSTRALPAIDPFAPMADGCWDDGVVRVAALAPGRLVTGVRTPNFHVRVDDDRVVVYHRLTPDRLGNDIAGLIAGELFRPGLLCGADLFERIFVGVVRSTVRGALPAWSTFYSATLAAVRGHWRAPGASGTQLADMAPVYRRVIDLTPPGRVLDLGSCFGFLPLLLARSGHHEVVASDLSAGSMRLLARISAAWGANIGALVRDAAATGLPDNSFHTVTAVHLLEHVDGAYGRAILREAVRLASRRVVVAVPFEDEPDPVFGHVRTFDLPELSALGVETGLPYSVAEHHGGWLVLETG